MATYYLERDYAPKNNKRLAAQITSVGSLERAVDRAITDLDTNADEGQILIHLGLGSDWGLSYVIKRPGEPAGLESSQ